MTQIWSIYNREHRLVLGLSDEPGIFNFTKPPSEELEPVECHYATFQCYDLSVEAEMLTLLEKSESLERFLQGLLNAGYSVIDGPPQVGRFSRL